MQSIGVVCSAKPQPAPTAEYHQHRGPETRSLLHQHDQEHWAEFTGRPDIPLPTAPSLTGRSVLITGAGGFIGSALARAVARPRPSRLVLLDHAEAGLASLQDALAPAPHVRFVLGDIRDTALCRDLMQQARTDLVLHAAAAKYVPLLETNPFAAASVNAFGTRSLLEASQAADVRLFLHVSTDKAADPISVLGVTKRLAELVALTPTPTPAPVVKAIRLGNVLGSTGSIAPRLQRQIAQGGSLTITHPDATRFFLTPNEAVHHILQLADLAHPASLFAPELTQQHRITDLAHFLIRRANHTSTAPPITYTGLRPGDKLTETLFAANEHATPTPSGLLAIDTPLPTLADLTRILHLLEKAVHERDLTLLLEALRQAVPEYRPSDLLLSQLAPAAAGTSA
jgi:FlaA1/EpsC-like NDP-sugar epimerase